MRRPLEVSDRTSTARPDQWAASRAGAPVVRIYRPAKNALQAGRANTRDWILEFAPQSPAVVEPLMGWTGTRDSRLQVRLKFPTREQAVAFARRQGWVCDIEAPHAPRLRPKCYADNFAWRSVRASG